MALTLFERGQGIVRLKIWVRRIHGNADGDDVLVVTDKEKECQPFVCV